MKSSKLFQSLIFSTLSIIIYCITIYIFKNFFNKIFKPDWAYQIRLIYVTPLILIFSAFIVSFLLMYIKINRNQIILLNLIFGFGFAYYAITENMRDNPAILQKKYDSEFSTILDNKKQLSPFEIDYVLEKIENSININEVKNLVDKIIISNFSSDEFELLISVYYAHSLQLLPKHKREHSEIRIEIAKYLRKEIDKYISNANLYNNLDDVAFGRAFGFGNPKGYLAIDKTSNSETQPFIIIDSPNSRGGRNRVDY